MLKNVFKRILLCVLAVMLVCLLTSCTTKLNGTYTVQDSLVNQSFTFEGDKVKVSAFGINVDGEYEIKGDEIIITYNTKIWNRTYSKILRLSK